MASKKSATRTAAASKKRNKLGAVRDLPVTRDLEDTPILPGTGDLADTRDLADTPTLRSIQRMLAMSVARERGASGDDILALARKHIGEVYVLGARAPMANSGWKGPWDCAEFVSWCVHQASGVLYGTQPQNDPILADAFTGFWAQQAKQGGDLISVDAAAGIAGAAVLRRPRPGAIGHIVLADGKGGTVEAHSSKLGVIAGTLSGRRWDAGILVPGVRYMKSDTVIALQPPPSGIIRLTRPLTRGPRVAAIQKRLHALGLAVGSVDGVFGPQSAHAVRLFQSSNGLVADGEVGPGTLAALGLPAA